MKVKGLRRVLSAAALMLAGTGSVLANDVDGGTLTPSCDGFTVSATAHGLTAATQYSASYSVTLSGCVPSPVTVTGTFPIVHNAASPNLGSGSGSNTWPATLNGVCVASGTAWLTQNPSVVVTLAATPAQFRCAPPPDVKGICHNIGGPRDLGADCDSSNTCSVLLQDGSTIKVDGNKFLGIVIKASPQATKAHIKHGDGPILVTFDPPLHLASQIGPHKASNVECLGERVNPQPPEPGN